MVVLLAVGLWFLLAVIFCLATGRVVSLADTANVASDQPSTRDVSGGFVTLAVHDYAGSASRAATDELLALRRGAIQRVAAP